MSERPKPSRAQLRRELRGLAQRFANDVMQLLDDSGFWEEPEPSSEEGPLVRRVRRSDAAIQDLAAQVEADLRARGTAAAISEIAEALGISARELAHPLNRLLSEERILRVGEKRGARYRAAPKARTARRNKTGKGRSPKG